MVDILRRYLIAVHCAHCGHRIDCFEIEALAPEIIRWAVCCDDCQEQWRAVVRARTGERAVEEEGK